MIVAPLGTYDGICVRSVQDAISNQSGGGPALRGGGPKAARGRDDREPPPVDLETGEILDGYTSRLARWELQSAARRLLPDHRVASCFRRALDTRDGVRVHRTEDRAAHFRGLRVCGAVWVCPVCAAKVSERRRAELREAIDRHQALGGSVALLTLTVPHHSRQGAAELSDELLDCYRRLWSGRQRITPNLEAEGYVGQVRSLEVTHGDHGWHPHLHTLLFFDQARPDLWAILRAVLIRWSDLVERAGLGRVNPVHGVSLQDGSAAAEYVSKWGKEPRWTVAEEVTKANVKRARAAGNRTPFALLEDYAAGDRQAGALFAEFVGAFKGRAQLFWSQGLRDRLGLGAQKSDEELAAEGDPLGELVAHLSWPEYLVVLRNNLQGVALELIRDGTAEDLRRLIDAYRPRTSPLPGPLPLEEPMKQRRNSAPIVVSNGRMTLHGEEVKPGTVLEVRDGLAWSLFRVHFEAGSVCLSRETDVGVLTFPAEPEWRYRWPHVLTA